MRKKAFTMLEVVIILVVIGILATLGFPAYENVIEDSKARVCQENQKALQIALDIYAMEHDTMPGDLSQIPAKYIEKAYARILQQKDAWRIKLAYFIVGWQERGLACAGVLTDIAGGNLKLITCPAAAPGERSYGLNSVLSGKKYAEYKALSGSTLLIGDCDKSTFNNESELITRHKHYDFLTPQNYGIAIAKDKKFHPKGIAKHKAKKFLKDIEDALPGDVLSGTTPQ